MHTHKSCPTHWQIKWKVKSEKRKKRKSAKNIDECTNTHKQGHNRIYVPTRHSSMLVEFCSFHNDYYMYVHMYTCYKCLDFYLKRFSFISFLMHYFLAISLVVYADYLNIHMKQFMWLSNKSYRIWKGSTMA